MPEQLTLLPQDIPANPFPLLASSAENKTPATSGHTSGVSSPQPNPLGSFSKMFMDTLSTGLTAFSPTWNRLATPHKRSVFRLVLSVPTTAENAYGLWPTPQAMDAMKARSPEAMERQMGTVRKGRSKIATMKDAAVYGLNWNGMATRLGDGELNPQHLEWMMGYPIGWTETDALATPSCHKSLNFLDALSVPTNAV